MRRKSTVRRVLLLIFAMALFAVVPGALANGSELVENGGFEAPVPSGSWDIFPGSGVPGWTVEWTDPDAACGGDREPLLEIQKSGTVVAAYEGNQYAELDTDCQPDPDVSTNVKISQTIDTVAGFNYGLDFAWKQRTSSDAMKVVAPGFENYYDDTFPANWAPETVVFTATGATSVVSFEETGDPAQSLGMFLDAVSCEFCVSDPTTSELVYGRKNVPVGEVTVSHDNEFIYVEFSVADPWVVYKTHVDVAAVPEDFPQNKGGLIPGQFEYGSGPYVPGSQNDRIEIPIQPGIAFVAFHAELFEVDFVNEGGFDNAFWASEVVDLDPVRGLDYIGDTIGAYDGSDNPVPGTRADPNQALGEPDSFFPVPKFYVPGFHGTWLDGIVGGTFIPEAPGAWIEVAFDGLIYNGDGDYDVSIHETTWGSDYVLEKVKVEASYGGELHFVGYADNKNDAGTALDGGITYLSLPDTIPYADFLRITDVTVPTPYPPQGPTNGFDIDAVDAASLILSEESGWGDTDGVTVGKNWSMYFPFEFNCPQPLPE